MPFVAAFLQGQKTRGFSPATAKRRRLHLRAFEAHCAPLPIVQATPELAEEWVAMGRAASSRHARLSDLRVFYEWARKRGFVEHPPTDRIDPVRVPKTLPRPLSAQDIGRALAACDDADTRLAVMLGAFAGLRVAEIAALQGEHVQGAILLVRQGKGQKDRVVPLHDRLRRELAEHPRAGYLFPSEAALRPHVAPQTISARIQRAFAAVGVTMTAHQLRHSFGTMAVDVSGDIQAVAELMGHGSTDTTRIYARFNVRRGAEVVARMWEAS